MSNSESENDLDEAQHSSLLAAVSQLDNKQRVKPPIRKEASHQISEFHLSKNISDRKDVHLKSLAKVLNQRGSLAKVGKKLLSIQRKAKTLPPPLEKPVAARIHRSIGFENVKRQLGRWNAVVEANRVSDHLEFPLTQPTIYFETTDDFVEKLKSQTRTPLEAEMDEILNKSPAVQQERKEEAEYRLNLAEMRERRKEMARLRAQQSYMAAKASRQKKIKSKKYHRIQRKERIRQQLKDFEALQKVDPEAALKQLEQLERTRAEERVSLRHRNTGQWARNKAVRAKYDKESRQELAQQLAVSRDLTQKIQTGSSSEDDEEKESDSCVKRTASADIENPWITTKTTSEVEDFVSGYRKFWDKQNKKLTDRINVKEKIITESKENATNEEELQLENHCEDIVNSEDASVENEGLKSNNFKSENGNGNDTSRNSTYKNHSTTSSKIENDSSKCSTEKRKLSPSSSKGPRKQANKKTNEVKNSFLASKNIDKNSPLVATASNWIVTPIEDEEQNNCSHNNSLMENVTNKSETEINKLFDNVEKKLKKKVKTKLKRVREMLDTKKTKTSVTKPESEDESPSLKMKKTAVRADLDEELIEQAHNVSSHEVSSNVNLKELVAQSEIHNNEPEPSSNNIDPNRFIAMKPKHLMTDIPDIMTGGNEGIDDNEEEEEDDDDDDEKRQKIITEAFAEDDVVAEFRKEKEEAEEKSQPDDIDLTLPGWGEWGGKNLPVSKRKKRRFVIKLPKVPPRKDANKGTVIISEEKNAKMKDHQVSELPFPFTSVKDFEASIRAPLGNTWIPETAHRKLIKPQIVTKLGTVIKPMDEDMLVNEKVKVQELS